MRGCAIVLAEVGQDQAAIGFTQPQAASVLVSRTSVRVQVCDRYARRRVLRSTHAVVLSSLLGAVGQGNLAAITGFLVDLQQQGVRYDVRTLNILPNGKKKGQLKGTMLIQCAYIKGEL